MGIQRKQLVPATALGGSAALLYTVPAGTQAQITAAAALNTSASTVTLKAYVVASGGSAGSSNQVCNKGVLAGDAYVLSELLGQTLPAGTKLYAEGNGVNLIVSGVEFV